MRAGPSTSDLWSRLWWRKLLCAPPLAALFAHGLCWTAFIGPFSPRFFLLWSPFVWLVHVLFLGRWLTMFVSPHSRNDAPSSVFMPVPPSSSQFLPSLVVVISSSSLHPLWSFLFLPLLSCCCLLNTTSPSKTLPVSRVIDKYNYKKD